MDNNSKVQRILETIANCPIEAIDEILNTVKAVAGKYPAAEKKFNIFKDLFLKAEPVPAADGEPMSVTLSKKSYDTMVKINNDACTEIERLSGEVATMDKIIKALEKNYEVVLIKDNTVYLRKGTEPISKPIAQVMLDMANAAKTTHEKIRELRADNVALQLRIDRKDWALKCKNDRFDSLYKSILLHNKSGIFKRMRKIELD